MKRLLTASVALTLGLLASCGQDDKPGVKGDPGAPDFSPVTQNETSYGIQDETSHGVQQETSHEVQSVQEIRKRQGFPIRVTAVGRETLTNTVEATGEISEFRRVVVGVQVEAVVSAVHFDIGDEVEEGAPLAELDKRELQAQIEQAKAARDAAGQMLAKLKAGSRNEEIAAARASLDGAIARLRVAEDDYDRARELAAQGAIAAKDLELATGQFHEGKARRREAEERLKLAELGPRQEDIDAAEAQLREATARISVLEVKLAKHDPRSPISGTITEKFLERGEFAKMGAALAEILDSHQVYAELDVPEVEIGKIRKGQEVAIRADALPGREFTDKIQTILPQATGDSHLYRCRVLLDNRKGLLKAGMFVQATIEVGSIPDCLTIPEEALVNGDRVYRVTEKGTVELVNLKVGVSQRGRLQVLSGLHEGDQIAITNLASLRDGLKVRPVEE